MSAGGPQATYTPTQLQKLFFLLDREIPDKIGGPVFVFVPYDYGPHDRKVYSALDLLRRCHQINGVVNDGSSKSYALTPPGFDRGTVALNGLDTDTIGYIKSVAKWVMAVSFLELVTTIYRRYPDMKVNSIFNGTKT